MGSYEYDNETPWQAQRVERLSRSVNQGSATARRMFWIATALLALLLAAIGAAMLAVALTHG